LNTFSATLYFVHFCETVAQDMAGTVLADHIAQGNITKTAKKIVKMVSWLQFQKQLKIAVKKKFESKRNLKNIPEI